MDEEINYEHTQLLNVIRVKTQIVNQPKLQEWFFLALIDSSTLVITMKAIMQMKLSDMIVYAQYN